MSYFYRSDYSLGQKNSTHINLVPLQIGLKYLFNISPHARLYFGLGATPTYLNTKDNSRYVIQSVHKWGIGGIIKAGACVNFKNYFLDFFTDYSFTQIPFHDTHHGRLVRHNADVSGWTWGAGIGYRF